MNIPPDIKKFRLAILPCARFVFVGGMLVLLGIIFVTDGRHFNHRALWLAISFAVVMAVIEAWVISLVFSSGFSAEGIYGHSFWGVRRFVPWSTVTGVRPFRLANLRWLRIDTAKGVTLWLPLFQAHPAEFREEIRRLAPPGNLILPLL